MFILILPYKNNKHSPECILHIFVVVVGQHDIPNGFIIFFSIFLFMQADGCFAQEQPVSAIIG